MLELSLFSALLAGSTWFGAMIFLSAVLAPMVFRVLSQQGASIFLRSLFPRYYKLGIGCGVILHIALLSLIPLTEQLSAALLWSTVGSVTILLLSIYSLVLVPRINAAKDAGNSMKKTFDALHLRSVIINVFNILVTLFVLINLAFLFSETLA